MASHQAFNGGVDMEDALAAQALRESEELHRVTLLNMSDAVFITNDLGIFTFICPNADLIFGYGPDEIRAMERISRLLGRELVDRELLAASGEIRNIEHDVTTKSGTQRALLVHIKQVAIKGGTTLYTCRDRAGTERAPERLSHELHPARLSSLGLETSIHSLCRDVGVAHGVAIDSEISGAASVIDSDLALCLYRITQEALQNVVKHSGAGRAAVALAVQNNDIMLSVSDDGAGFDPQAVQGKDTLGLVSMRERARLVKGHLEVTSAPGHGTRVNVVCRCSGRNTPHDDLPVLGAAATTVGSTTLTGCEESRCRICESTRRSIFCLEGPCRSGSPQLSYSPYRSWRSAMHKEAAAAVLRRHRDRSLVTASRSPAGGLESMIRRNS
jgi:PAS domain S-box-containing protein